MPQSITHRGNNEKVKRFGKRKLKVSKIPTYKGQPEDYFGVIISKLYG